MPQKKGGMVVRFTTFVTAISEGGNRRADLESRIAQHALAGPPWLCDLPPCNAEPVQRIL